MRLELQANLMKNFGTGIPSKILKKQEEEARKKREEEERI